MEKNTFAMGNLDEKTGGVVIGQGVLQNATKAKGSVVIGIANMMHSTDTFSLFNTIIGRNACQNMAGSSCSNNVVIGNQAMMDPGSSATCSNNVVVGADACRGPNIGNDVVCIGARAGYRGPTSQGVMGTHTIMIGADTGNMGTSNNYIGDYSISLGTASSNAVPSDTMLLGRGAQATSANSGQIVFGSNSHYGTLLAAVTDQMTFQTGGGATTQSLFLSPATCSMTSSGSTKITCGSNEVELTPSKCILPAIPLILSGIVCDSDGKSVIGIGNSIWVEGRSDGLAGADLEKRRIAITPKALLGDRDSSTRSVQVWVGDSTIVSDTDFPLDSSADLARGYGATRVNHNNETFIYLDQPPPGWKIVAIYISMMHKSNYSSSSRQMEVFSRRYLYTVPKGETNSQSTHLTFHKTKADNVYTNSLITLTPPYIHDGTNYCAAFMSSGSSNALFIGGFAYIMRI